MNERPLQLFLELIKFDRSIFEIESAIDSLRKSIFTFKNEELSSQRELEKMQQRVHSLRKDVDVLELELKELDQQEQTKKKQLDQISNYKEYQSLQTEIDKLKLSQHKLEQILLELWNKFESAKRDFEAVKKTYDEKNHSLKLQIDQKEKEVASLQNDLDSKKSQRQEKEQKVPEEWLEKYNAMRARVADPVAPVEQSSCSACSYMISDQDIIRLKRGAVLQCKGCFRFLYVSEVMQQELSE